MLPVEFDAQGVNSSADALADKPIRLELTAAGRANPMLRLSDKDEENAALWKQLPPSLLGRQSQSRQTSRRSPPR